MEQFTDRIFGLPPARFSAKHGAMLRALRALLAPAGPLPEHAARLVPLLQRGLDAWPHGGDKVHGVPYAGLC